MSQEDKDIQHELVDFMHAVTNGIQAEYIRIQRRLKEDPGTAGDEGEENWAELLRSWLPSNYKIVTKGRIIGGNGVASPQIDILVLKPFYPNYLLNKKLYLSAGVVAAFECKLTLRRKHILSAFETSVKIRQLIGSLSHDPLHEMYSPIIYGILAHSHEWKKDASDPIKNINSAIQEDDVALVTHPRECLDFICVSDLTTWSTIKHPSILHYDKSLPTPTHIPVAVPATYYCISLTGPNKPNETTPIGAFLSSLLNIMSVNDDSIKSFARHFRSTGIWLGATPVHHRHWHMDIFSDESKRIYQKQGLIHFDNWKKIFPL